MKDPIDVLKLAGELKQAGHYEEAEHILMVLLEDHPQLVVAYNNLGTIYYAQQKWPLAIIAFQQAIALQADYIDAYYNLGLAFKKSGDVDQALIVFQALEELSQGHPGGEFHSGCILMSRGRYSAAITQFLAMQMSMPDHPEMLSNLGTCYLHLNKLNEAMTHYMRALALLPDDTQILFNLGVINMKLGRMKEAINFYLQAVRLDTAHFAAHNNLGVAYLALQNADTALLHFRAASLAKPDNVAIKHTINLLEHKKDMRSSPKEYVSSLFDSYADYYDPHVLYTLHYVVPQAIYDMVTNHVQLVENGWDVLDLGCGTGLCGQLFKTAAKSLVGIDLSPKMLEAAATKDIYNELVEADAVSYMDDHANAYDLITAGDVIVYFGELHALFSAVSTALRKNAYFAFSAEIGELSDYAVGESGRFAHKRTYIEGVANQMSLHVVDYQQIALRTQHDVPVLGHLYLLQKRQ